MFGELELMAEMLWGFGGVKFVYGTTEMELPHCAENSDFKNSRIPGGLNQVI